ncbi:MAG: hypothetical protein JXA42_04215 [Anaerolineales bacterium]|nr:hypothetical protein [Anaerolineales bacterium]
MSATRYDNTVMKKMMQESITSCAKKAGLDDKKQVVEALRKGNCCVCEHLRNELAQGMAEYLGSMDDSIKAIYSFDPEYATSMEEPLPGRPNLSPGFSLIARVNRENGSLSDIVDQMKTSLKEEHRLLSCPKANALCTELNLNIANDDDVQKRTGYGALINSPYVRPIELWSR